DLRDLYSKVFPDALAFSKPVLDAVQDVDFAKYCLKMATGTGKTWVLMALLVWQYFNALNNEKPHGANGDSKDWYSNRFLLVAPGHEVLNRLLDAFKGRRDQITHLRDPSTADYGNSLMMPESWRSSFNLQILEPHEVRANTTPPECNFLFL